MERLGAQVKRAPWRALHRQPPESTESTEPQSGSHPRCSPQASTCWGRPSHAGPPVGGNRPNNDMIISPSEQSNILSVYDSSPSQFSGFETIYAKLLFLVWNTFSNYPVCVYFSIRSFPSNYLPLSRVATSSIAALYAAVLGGCLPFVHFLSAPTYEFFVTTGLAGSFTIIDAVYYVYHASLSLLWYTL